MTTGSGRQLSRIGRHRRQEAGFALVAVLWFLILLSALSASYSLTTRTNVALARNIVGASEAEAAADAGLQRALASLITTQDRQPFRLDGTPYSWAFDTSEVRFVIEDEGGKIDINAASEPLLAALFRVAGVVPKQADGLAAAIADFRDEDHDRRPTGAEDPDYARDKAAQGAKDAPFQAIEELMQVKGMTGILYRAIAPAVTIFSGAEQPEEKVAPPVVVAALGELSGRGTVGRAFSTEGFLKSQGEARSARQSEAVSDRQQAVGRGNSDRATTALTGEEEEDEGGQSGLSTFGVHVEARTANGSVFAREAVVRITPDQVPPYSVLAWRQGPRWLFPPTP
ncbi:MAG: type II secretion system protein GspK [Rhodospirillales bacterium]